ncbi:sarcosine oxidase subunit gamma [Marinomonas mediterranea]|uniref:sarcosine oxidase subunit gamma n=1 Tax=Marinomonas mediterranea TaxID=119864 RepID=UPI00234A87C6|nr:sarcosine oxidase subunit gamma [Marinomonas mediterranea]
MTMLKIESSLSTAAHLRRSIASQTSYTSPKSGVIMENQSIKDRIGFRGKGARSFLEAQGITVPSKPNQSVFENGMAVLRLSATEVWLIDLEPNPNSDTKQAPVSTANKRMSELDAAANDAPNVYRLFCQHSHAQFCFYENKNGSQGHRQQETLATLFSKVCGVDLRDKPFPVGSIAQTSVARVNAIVVKGSECFYLLSDIASSDYLWNAMSDSAQEF